MPLHSKLYKLNSNGKSVQVWEIHHSEDYKSYWTVSGQVDGAMTESAPTLVVPKVKRSQEEQLLLEVTQKVNLQIRKKYVENIEDVGLTAETSLPGYSAMLAKKWEDQKHQIKFPCIVQPKLDGVRCLATKFGLFTRGRKEIDSCDHVFEALKPFFAKYPDAQLDGELYTHEFKDDFESIISAVRKGRKSAKPHHLALQAKVQYHIYDAPRIAGLTETDPFIKRFFALEALKDLPPASIRLVPTVSVKTEAELIAAYEGFLDEGYEGAMVRNINMKYQGSRSSELLKMKLFDDDEFEILGVNEGKGSLAGHAATFNFIAKSGNEFRAKMDGETSRLATIWKDPSLVIGKMATVRYQGLSNKSKVPRFPVVKAVRGEKDGSDWL